MELMSPLLLYAFLTLVPQARGKSKMGYSYYDTANDTVTKKRAVFTDPSCKSCVNCMERVVKAHKVHRLSKIRDDDIYQLLTKKDNKIKQKRSVNFETKGEKKSKKTKAKKSVSVIKYNENGEIYALKVKETNNQLISEPNVTRAISTTCQVYSIQKSLPCESPEADLILTASKRKTNKKNKKVQGKRETNVPTEEAVIASMFRKRHVDNSELQEHYMTSLEEMY
ncbi:unnamed protein product [Pieris macdunnoughi]|uniref:Uncharacterized protein n=1 Tax=Pieris macdunnoughi TaxID=345717 RepID=A0A821QKS7_9NEOP|nr:unnamed protein product [Pieris macdunnoughi]